MAFSLDPMKEPIGILKVLLLVFALLAFAPVAGTRQKCAGSELKYDDIDNSKFFLFVSIMLFLVALALIVAYLVAFDFLLNFPAPFSFWTVELSFSGSWAFMSLLGAALFAKGISNAKDDAKKLGSLCDVNFAGWEFGDAMLFFGFFILLVNCYYVYKEIKDPRSGSGPSNTSSSGAGYSDYAGDT